LIGLLLRVDCLFCRSPYVPKTLQISWP
jgi:hypothetical protein